MLKLRLVGLVGFGCVGCAFKLISGAALQHAALVAGGWLSPSSCPKPRKSRGKQCPNCSTPECCRLALTPQPQKAQQPRIVSLCNCLPEFHAPARPPAAPSSPTKRERERERERERASERASERAREGGREGGRGGRATRISVPGKSSSLSG